MSINKWVTILISYMFCIVGVIQAQDDAEAPTDPNYPAWAWAIPGPDDHRTPTPPLDDKKYTLPGSRFSFTLGEAQGRDPNDRNARFGPADWFPEDHPIMPKIVADGDNDRNITPCSLCHLPNGKGRPENAPPAGQPKEYTVTTLMDMKNGLRGSADKRKGNVFRMNAFAEAMTVEEINEVAEYYASMKWTPWIIVKEVEEVPKMYSSIGMWIPEEGDKAGMEPIGMRVIETPENVFDAEILRGPRSKWIAYVPVGAIEKGKNLVTTGGNGKTMPCASCHGPDLHGMGAFPGIAARSPSYIARQLYSYQTADRNGAMSMMMKGVVANMTNDDFVNITAYLASLPAQAEEPTFNTE
jgi:cytochrome c553